MKVMLFFFIIFSFILTNSFGQSLESDTIGLYSNGRIKISGVFSESRKIYEDKTIFLRKYYENESKFIEYYRYDESTFLYTEYYKRIDTTSTIYTPVENIRCQGLAEVSNLTTGFVLTAYDPVTYEASEYRDTLLLPKGEWIFYHANGKKKAVGTYNTNKRDGEWKYYDNFEYLSRIITYRHGEIINDEIVDVVLKNNKEATRNNIEFIWIERSQVKNHHLSNDLVLDSFSYLQKIEKVEGIGNIYHFKKDGKIAYVRTEIVEKEYKINDGKLTILNKYDIAEELHGTWRLVDTNKIEIILDRTAKLYKIDYLSDTKMRLLKF